MTMPNGPMGALLSFKSDIPSCMAYRNMLVNSDEYEWMGKEAFDEMLNYNEPQREADGFCNCRPPYNGAVWSQVMALPESKVKPLAKNRFIDTLEDFQEEIEAERQDNVRRGRAPMDVM